MKKLIALFVLAGFLCVAGLGCGGETKTSMKATGAGGAGGTKTTKTESKP